MKSSHTITPGNLSSRFKIMIDPEHSLLKNIKLVHNPQKNIGELILRGRYNLTILRTLNLIVSSQTILQVLICLRP